MSGRMVKAILILKTIVLTCTVTIVLIACSGGESGTGFQPTPETNDTVEGPITGFGSVIVNGIKFNTSNSSVSIDGAGAVEKDLSVGMIVTVKGSIADATASSVNAKIEARGLVTNISSEVALSGVGTISVMGQKVLITTDTVFKSKVTSIVSVDQLEIGSSVVDVSGFIGSGGAITATYLKLKSNNADSSEVKVKGIVSNLNTASAAFMIGDLNINYVPGTTKFEDMQIDDLADGLFVEVESDSGFDSGTNSITANEISREDFSKDHKANGEVDIEGVVTRLLGTDNTFELSGRTVQVDANTQYDPQLIVLDARLKVEGSVLANGTILADEIESHKESDAEVSGLVESKDSGNKSLTVGGIVVFVTESTRYEAENNHMFNFDAIEAGITVVEIHYYFDDSTGRNIATSIEQEEENA